MDFELKKFDPKTANQKDWDKFHEFRHKYHDYLRPDDPMEPDDISQRNTIIRLKNPDYDFTLFGMVGKDSEELIGTLVYGWLKEGTPMYEKNPDIGFIEIQLLPDFRRQGIGSQLLKIGHKAIKETGRKIIISGTEEKDGREFAKKIGANEALGGVENRLQLSELDWDLMKQWIKTGEERNPNTQIQFHYEIPNEIINHYAEVYTETLKQVPMGELQVEPIQTPELIRKDEKERKAQEKIQLTTITVEEDGEISGLTELIYNPHVNTRLSQNLTSVREQHRGKGLGKWLKAAALVKAKEKWPTVKYVVTGNANSNAPMLAINNKMGFKIYRENVSIQVSVDDLEDYLSKIPIRSIE